MNMDLMNISPIKTARLHMARLQINDAVPLQAITNDPSITNAVNFLVHPFTVADSETLIRNAMTPGECFLGNWEKSDGELGPTPNKNIVG
jgi:hypothetical protein